VVASLARASDALHGVWAELDADTWTSVAHEPSDNPDIGSVPLVALALLRLTELEVQRTCAVALLHEQACDAGVVRIAYPFWRARRVKSTPVALQNDRRSPAGEVGDDGGEVVGLVLGDHVVGVAPALAAFVEALGDLGVRADEAER
jgi:hypothetical protein